MTDAEAEIRATITVQTTESTAAKSDKDVCHGKTSDGRRGTVFGGRRDTLVTGQRHKTKSGPHEPLPQKPKFELTLSLLRGITFVLRGH